MVSISLVTWSLPSCQGEDVDVEVIAQLPHNGDDVMQVCQKHQAKVHVECEHLISRQCQRYHDSYEQRDEKEVETLCRLAGHLTDNQPTLKNTNTHCTSYTNDSMAWLCDKVRCVLSMGVAGARVLCRVQGSQVSATTVENT